jgi:hypothetical protein
MKPNANSKLYVSCKNICDHTKRRLEALKTNAAKNARSQLLPKPSDNDIDKIRRDLSKHIVEDKRDKVLQQFCGSSGMFHIGTCLYAPTFTCHLQFEMCLSFHTNNTDYSFHIYEQGKTDMTCLVRKANVAPPSIEERGPIPCYHLTRCVTICEGQLSSGKTCVFINCSCKFQKRVKGPCRHIYCVLDESPIAEHFGLEVFKEYEANYAEDVEYTRQVDQFINEVDCRGGAVLLSTTLAEFQNKMKLPSDAKLEWFLETLNDVGIDVNPFQQSRMNVDDALIKDNGGGKRPRIGTHSKHNNNKKKRNTTTSWSLPMIADAKKQSAYNRLHTCYREATEACKTEDDMKNLEKLLNDFRFRTLCKNSGSSISSANGGEVSLPEIETQKTVPRKKPMMSPVKRSR